MRPPRCSTRIRCHLSLRRLFRKSVCVVVIWFLSTSAEWKHEIQSVSEFTAFPIRCYFQCKLKTCIKQVDVKHQMWQTLRLKPTAAVRLSSCRRVVWVFPQLWLQREGTRAGIRTGQPGDRTWTLSVDRDGAAAVTGAHHPSPSRRPRLLSPQKKTKKKTQTHLHPNDHTLLIQPSVFRKQNTQNDHVK